MEPMHRYSSILTPLLGIVFCHAVLDTRTTCHADDELPNIVVLFVDDLGYFDVGFRNKDFHTPNIDKLASQAMVLNNAYVPSPACSPSRVGLYTGQHPARLQFYRHIPGAPKGEFHLWMNDPALLPSRNYLPLDTVTYAEVVKKKGYKTLFVGKWHLGGAGYGPFRQGWDQVINRHTGGTRWQGYYASDSEEQSGRDQSQRKYLTDHLTDKVVDFVRQYDNDEPFLIQFSYHNVHSPTQGRKDFLEMYRKRGFTGELVEYGAQVSAVDASVGRVLDALQESGKTENTIIIFVSDQGSLFPNRPLRGSKAVGTALFEGGLKVPFLVKWPGRLKPGTSTETHVQTSDIFPTICEIVGDSPSNYQGLEALSLVGVLTRNEPLDRKAIFALRSYDGQYASVLTRDNWKLIAYRDNRYELFKVDEDISEARDLAGQLPERVKELAALLKRWKADTGVPF